MITRAQKVRLGIFLIFSTVVLFGTIGTLAGLKLIEKNDMYTIRFNESLAGLEKGASVKYNGIWVGRVEDLEINRTNVSEIVTTISLKAGTPVKKDTVAVVTSSGITGAKYIELSGGTSASDFLPPGSEIPSGESFMGKLTGKAEIIAEKVELLTNKLNELLSAPNREKLMTTVGNIDSLAVSARDTIEENRPAVKQVIVNLEESTDRLDHTVAVFESEGTAALKEIRSLAANLNQAVEKQRIRHIVENVDVITTEARVAIDDAQIQEMVKKLGQLVDELLGTVTNIDNTVLRAKDDIFVSLSYLEDALEDLSEFARMIRENPGLLLGGSDEKERKLP
ncbi:MAG TPA: MlaD family protein [Myxococcota bacterium]|nr:MlaD family protein [Myxococcota bacterium]